ncbi:hypothetical protein PI124_g18808 [Phytophthora idaei]|nr:hypothetical protein PI125_g21230 [Phytophthora idaei]KAG3236181.1 hypothetical protein PI124_g18808 [Phytophthora idaei]
MSTAQRQPQQGRAASGHPSQMAKMLVPLNSGRNYNFGQSDLLFRLKTRFLHVDHRFAHAAGSGSGSVWLSPSPLGPLHRRPRTRSANSSAPAENPLKGRLFFACATERANWRQEASQ